MCLALGLLLCLYVAAAADYVPPCNSMNACRTPMECYTCTDAEYQVYSGGVGGYPASAQCSATMTGCLYCWKQTQVLTLADGWSSEFQYKSCIPWPVNDGCSGDLNTCEAEYAQYSVNYCTKALLEKTVVACANGGWCTKSTTECACSTPLCNLSSRVAAHNLATSILAALALALALRKCAA